MDKIPQVLNPSMPLDPLGAVLVNALYFKGEWAEKFEEKDTSDGNFHGNAGKSKCKMMSAKAPLRGNKFLYGETNTYQAAVLPYGNGDKYSAVIILPRDGSKATLTMPGGGYPDIYRDNEDDKVDGAASKPRKSSINEVLTTVMTDWSTLSEKAKCLNPTKGSLRFPRFKVEFGTSLKELLKPRGMSLAFGPGADFSAMSDTPLMISEVIHKTCVEVNEVGTEAAAVTAVIMSRALPRPEPSFCMQCDRPFLFFIRSEESNAMIFAGVVGQV